MLRVLLINQFFWPDMAATAQLLADLAEDLAAAHYAHKKGRFRELCSKALCVSA